MPQELNDATIQVRVPRKVIATIAIAFYDAGDYARSLSELGRRSMIEFANILVANGKAPKIESALDATRGLERAGLGNLNVGGRGLRSYFRNLHIEEAIAEGHSPFEETKVKTRRGKGADLDRQLVDHLVESGFSKEDAAKQVGGFGQQEPEFDESAAAERIRQKDEKLKKGLADEVPEVVAE